MTNEEAIKILKEDMRRYNCIIDSLKSGADSLTDGEAPLQSRGLAIKALEKQIPRKPVEQGDGINCNCPACGRYVGYIDAMAWEIPKYCDECGQALDWSGEDD